MDFDFNPRAAEALKLRRQGLTLQQVGNRLGGVTRERARQLIHSAVRQEMEAGPFNEHEMWRNHPVPQKNPA